MAFNWQNMFQPENIQRAEQLFPMTPMTPTPTYPSGQTIMPPPAPPVSGVTVPIEQQVPLKQAPIEEVFAPEVYSPESGATEQYNKLMSEMPVRGKPSVFRRIVGSLAAGTGDLEAAKYIRDKPYYDALEDWKIKMGYQQPAMVQEREANRINRLSVANTNTANLQNRRITNQEEAAEAKAKNDAENTKIRAFRAAAYDWRVRNPAGKMIADMKSGYLYESLPDGSTRLMRTPDGEPIEHGKLGQEALTNLQADRAEDLAHARGEEARKTEEVKGSNRKLQTFYDENGKAIGTYWVDGKGKVLEPASPDDTGRIVSTTRPPKSATADGEEEKPSQTRDRRFNNAQKAKQQFPHLAQWIKVKPDDTVEITPPRKPDQKTGNTALDFAANYFNRGPTQAEYDMLYDFIQSKNPVTTTPTIKAGPTGHVTEQVTTPSKTTTAPTNTAPKAPPGRTVLYDVTTGRAVTVPDAQVEAALKTKKYRR